MGRPRGLKKDKATGKWYMPDKALSAQETFGGLKKPLQKPALPKEIPVHVPVITKESTKVKDELFQRNETVRVYNGVEWESALVLGYLRGKVVAQLLRDNSRVLAVEDLVKPNPSKDE